MLIVHLYNVLWIVQLSLLAKFTDHIALVTGAWWPSDVFLRL